MQLDGSDLYAGFKTIHHFYDNSMKSSGDQNFAISFIILLQWVFLYRVATLLWEARRKNR